ncbi:MAG: glycosyltransferase family 61 protein [Pyrinomonadaceae bacterium]
MNNHTVELNAGGQAHRRDILLSPAIQIERHWPLNLDQADIYDFEYEQSFRTYDTFLRHYGCAWISPDSIIYKNGILADETLAHRSYRGYYRFRHLVKKLVFSKKIRLPKGKQYLMVTDSWSETHFHWLTDVLPKLLLLGESLKQYTLLLPATPYLRTVGLDSLRLADLTFEEVVLMQPDHFYYAPELSFVTKLSKSGSMHDPMMKELQSRYTKNAGDAMRKIYISRRKARIRYVLNDDEVIACLRDYGFETPFAEDLDLEAQIELFNSANMILGIHGAGLTNALFMKPGGAVVELRKREGPGGNVCYWHLADSVNQRYYYLNGESDRDHGLSGTGCNLTISIPELERRVLKPLLSDNPPERY